MSAAMSGPAPIITGQYRLSDVRHITADCSKAARVLGWRSRIRLEDGVADLATYGWLTSRRERGGLRGTNVG
jgi:dTDP-L-rhamnose 4-epimerase